MKDFVFSLPTKIIFGAQSHESLKSEITTRTNKTVMLCYGKSSIKDNGIYDIVTKQLNDAGIKYIEFSGIKANPDLVKAREGVKLCRDNDVGLLLAVGGGSVIDTAKTIAIGALFDGDIWELYEKSATATASLPVGVVLTMAAAGSEMSNSAVITNEEEYKKYGMAYEFMRPQFSILNPKFTMSVDKTNSAAGICDIYAHLHERYFTNTPSVSSVDRMIEGLMVSVVQSGCAVINDGQDYDARAEIMWAGCMAHNDVFTVGRDTDWASHRIEHELSAYYGLSHGAGLAIVMPAWMKFCYKEDVDRFACLAVNVFGVKLDAENKEATALMGIKRLENFIHDLGLPTTLSAYGIDDSKFKVMARAVTRNETIKVGCVKVLSVDDIEAIYRLAL